MRYVGNRCVGCGVCIGLCPANAIHIKVEKGVLKPEIDKAKCIQCDSCIRFCAVIRNMYIEPCSRDINKVVGKPIRVYTGFATEDSIRIRGASGGVVTSLLNYLFDEKIIDYAVVARQKGIIAKPFIVPRKEYLKDTQGSVYFPSFMLKALKSILSNVKNCAFVGLPCQVDALKRIECEKEKLKEKVKVHLGLFCNHVNEYWYVWYLTYLYKGDECYPISITPRSGFWPGSISIKTSCGECSLSLIDFWKNMPSLYFSSPVGCVFCENHLNVNADIALGDAWLPELAKEGNMGTSMIVAFTDKGKEIIEDANEKNYISIEEVNLRDLVRSQLENIVVKYKIVPIRRKILRRKFSADIFNGNLMNNMFMVFLPLINSYLGGNMIFREAVLKNRALTGKILDFYRLLMQRVSQGLND